MGKIATMAAATAIAVAGLVCAGPGSNAASMVERASGTPECTNANLTASYKATDAGAGHRFGRIILKNTSSQTCWVQGYGGLSYVGGGNGTQIGAPADRTPSHKPRVTLAPGQKVRSLVDATVAVNYPRKTCQPRHVDGFRVYVPDETHSQFVPHVTRGCANPNVHLLQHKAYHPVHG